MYTISAFYLSVSRKISVGRPFFPENYIIINAKKRSRHFGDCAKIMNFIYQG